MLFFLVLAWPGLNLMLLLPGQYEINYELMDPVIFIFLPTIIIQWFIFFGVALTIWREKALLSTVGLVKPRLIDFPIAILFLIASNLILIVLQFFLTLLGLPVSRDVDIIVAKAGESVWWWLAVSVTAAFCEEVAFRGFIITRVRSIARRGWLIPVILSSLAFATGHLYQGGGGFILILVYGLLFCGLFLVTRSLWPGIIAHFIQDFLAIFVYKWFDF